MADSGAFDDLYRTARDRLAVQIAAFTGDRIEASDLVQDAFMRAWLSWDRVAAYDDPEGWVRRVAFNLAVSRWRRARRIMLRASVPDRREEDPGERRGAVDALQALPTTERRAIVLHHLAGLSVAEVAAEMRAPEGTVKSWLSRGRARMAAAMAPLRQSDEFDARTVRGAVDG